MFSFLKTHDVSHVETDPKAGGCCGGGHDHQGDADAKADADTGGCCGGGHEHQAAPADKHKQHTAG